MSEFEKAQCTCAHGYTCRAMRDPNCCAHSCDYNDTVDALNKVTADRDAALAQVEHLKGIKPELPPRTPQWEGLPRYGIRWNGPTEPLTVPLGDGHWTPYHLALAQNAELVAQVEALLCAAINVCNHIEDDCMNTNGLFSSIEKLQEAVNKTPNQHLRDIQADAGRAGVIHMHNILAMCYAGYGSDSDSAEAVLIADQYAARVKAGEV